MTFREKLLKEYPDRVEADFGGTAIETNLEGHCFSCPCSYGYEKNSFCDEKYDTAKCEFCWSRTIPEENMEKGTEEREEEKMEKGTENVNITLTEYNALVRDSECLEILRHIVNTDDFISINLLKTLLGLEVEKKGE